MKNAKPSRWPRSTVGALEVVVVGGGVDVALVAQELERVVHVVAAHSTSDLRENIPNVRPCTFRKMADLLRAFQNK